MPDILSVGIDIGTSTTQIIFSKLAMENTSGYFTVPHVSIVDKKVVYKSEVFLTPLINDVRIDTFRVREIVDAAYQKAGFSPADVDSGAVIITGESARKENADAVLATLSDFAGDFVVSAAGPDMESVIAGKGSGAFEYSMKTHSVVANLDIGGGTTNVAVFDDGDVIARGCLDIGGRLICVDPQMIVTKISPAAAAAAAAAGVHIRVGDPVTGDELGRITDTMARALSDYIGGQRSPLLDRIKTPGSSDFTVPKRIDAVCFSGGVAESIYFERNDTYAFGDIGTLLGHSIKASALMQSFQVIPAGETIRATVVGAGTYTTTISGSTITYTADIFPLKNIPVYKLDKTDEMQCFEGAAEGMAAKIRWFMKQRDTDMVVLAMDGPENPSYRQTLSAAGCLCTVMDQCLAAEAPVILVVGSDIAKALGQLMQQQMSGRRQIVAIDSIKVEDGDYVDMGRPVMEGMVIPVVVKTLIFG